MRQRLYNLTDVPTPALRQKGLVMVHVKVGEETIPPGGFAEMVVTPAILSETFPHRLLGAICIGTPSQPYLRKSEELKAQYRAAPPAPTEAPPAPAAEELVQDEQEEEPEEPELAVLIEEPSRTTKRTSKKRRRRG